jgi:hypothetical protein
MCKSIAYIALQQNAHVIRKSAEGLSVRDQASQDLLRSRGAKEANPNFGIPNFSIHGGLSDDGALYQTRLGCRVAGIVKIRSQESPDWVQD